MRKQNLSKFFICLIAKIFIAPLRMEDSDASANSPDAQRRKSLGKKCRFEKNE
jgi:hypothetical protein